MDVGVVVLVDCSKWLVFELVLLEIGTFQGYGMFLLGFGAGPLFYLAFFFFLFKFDSVFSGKFILYLFYLGINFFVSD